MDEAWRADLEGMGNKTRRLICPAYIAGPNWAGRSQQAIGPEASEPHASCPLLWMPTTSALRRKRSAGRKFV